MNSINKCGGVVVPMVTPFLNNLEIDYEAVDRIIRRFIDAGTFPFILGTSGEAPLISAATKRKLVEFAGKRFGGNTTLYSGISASSIDETINNGKALADFGFDIAVATVPSGYPLGANEQYRFFEKLASNIPVPLIIYNIPQTTNVSVDLQVIDRLSHHPNIIGIKDSESNDARTNWSLNQWKNREDFIYYTGSSFTSSYCLMNGGKGIVPSGGNFIPELYQKLFLAAISGDCENANNLQSITDEITNIYAGSKMLYNSIPYLKGIMKILGICSSAVMFPLEELKENEIEELTQVIRLNPYLEETSNPNSTKLR